MSGEARIKRIDADIQRLEKRKRDILARHKAAKRKSEKRRVLLIGQAVEQWASAGGKQEEWLRGLLDRFVTSDRDREFLGLG